MTTQKTFCSNPLHAPMLDNFPDSHHFDAIVVDEKTFEVMLRIEAKMAELAPMGYDELRSVWIETLRGDIEEWYRFEDYRNPDNGIEEERRLWKEEWEYNYPTEVIWFQISTQRYQDMMTLYISDGEYQTTFLSNKHNAAVNEPIDEYIYDFVDKLTQLEGYLSKVIDSIKENPQRYSDYLEEHLPFRKRKGRIIRKRLWEIIPSEKGSYGNTEEVMEMLRDLSSGKVTRPGKEMTLRKYIHYWAQAYRCHYRLLHEKASFKWPEQADDLEVFKHSPTGHDMSDYDLDSPADFDRWDHHSARFYHGYDLIYARVHLYPEKTEDGWVMHLTGGEAFFSDVFGFALGLYREKAPFVISSVDEILSTLAGSDEVEIVPGPCSSHVGYKQINLPRANGDDVTDGQIEELINAIDWEKVEAAVPNTDETE